MTPRAAPPVQALSWPRRGRDRLRLLVLLALVLLWVLPVWVKAQVGDASVPEVGAVRSGVTAALALLALWGLSATSLGACTLGGLRIGGALTDAAIALTTTGLLLVKHPWIPGGPLREAWVPIFGPLALLALLDALLTARRRDVGYEIPVIRAGAALFAAGALGVDQAWIPAGIALWLGLAPLMFLKLSRAKSARRSLEVFILVAAALAGMAPWIQKNLVGVHPALSGSDLTLPVYGWSLLAALVATLALDGVFRPEAEHFPASPR